MNNAVKVFVVSCGECGTKQAWDADTAYRRCGECDSTVVLQTASSEDLKEAKKNANSDSRIAFSNYMVYSLNPEDVEKVVTERKLKAKQEKDELLDRKGTRDSAVIIASNPARKKNRNNKAGKKARKAGKKKR